MTMHHKAISHRGRGDIYPDNTIESIDSAIKAGFQWIELDVRKTKDDTLILFHDDSIQGRKVKDLTVCELRELALESNIRVPTLEQAIMFAKGKIKFDIELKEYSMAKQVVEVVNHHINPSDFFITSFNALTLWKVRNIDKSIQTGIILDTFNNLKKDSRFKLFVYKRIFLLAKLIKLTHIVFHPKLISDSVLAKAEALGIQVYLWDINDEQYFKTMASIPNVKGIITDLRIKQ